MPYTTQGLNPVDTLLMLLLFSFNPSNRCVLEKCCDPDVQRGCNEPWAHIKYPQPWYVSPLWIIGLLIYLLGIPSGIALLASTQSGTLFLGPFSRTQSHQVPHCCSLFFILSTALPPALCPDIRLDLWGEVLGLMDRTSFHVRKTCVGTLSLLCKGWVPVCQCINFSELICSEAQDIILTGFLWAWKQCLCVSHPDMNLEKT